MCGRFSIPDQELLMKAFMFDEVLDYRRRFNIAPSQEIPAIKEKGKLTYLHWGLIPSWAKDRSIGYKMINARSETITEKPSFKNAFQKRRCLIISDGFYEWKKEGSKKQPMYIFMKGHTPFCFAGIWERWSSPEGEIIESTTILTTNANELIAPIHERMPVIVAKDNYDKWLSPSTSEHSLKELFASYPSSEMESYPVSTFVNKPVNEGEECSKQTVDAALS